MLKKSKVEIDKEVVRWVRSLSHEPEPGVAVRFDIPMTDKSSIVIRSKRLTRSRAAFHCQSTRRLETLRWTRAKASLALSLAFDPFCLRLKLRCALTMNLPRFDGHEGLREERGKRRPKCPAKNAT